MSELRGMLVQFIVDHHHWFPWVMTMKRSTDAGARPIQFKVGDALVALLIAIVTSYVGMEIGLAEVKKDISAQSEKFARLQAQRLEDQARQDRQTEQQLEEIKELRRQFNDYLMSERRRK